MKMILGLFALVAITMIDTSVEASNRDYCSLNFTTPKICLCKAKNEWQDQQDAQSTFNFLKNFCKEVSVASYIDIATVGIKLEIMSNVYL